MPFYPIALLAMEKANNHRPATPVVGAGSHTKGHRHPELYQAHVNLRRWFKDPLSHFGTKPWAHAAAQDTPANEKTHYA